MTIEERDMMRKLFPGPLYVIKLNHVNNLLKGLDPTKVTKERRGILRAQYTHMKPKWAFTLAGGYGTLRVSLSVAGTIALATQHMNDGSSLIIFNSSDRKKLLSDYADDLTKIGVPENPAVLDDPRNALGLARFGTKHQIADAEVQLGNKLIATLLSDNKKKITETDAYLSLVGIVPVEKLMNKRTQRI